MPCLKEFLKNFVLRSDMFAAQPSMRYNGESSYESMCGGFLSIFLVIGFAVIFSTSFLNVLQKVEIQASLEIQDNAYHTESIQGMFFAVGIEDIDFGANQSHFTLRVEKFSRSGRTTTMKEIQLEVCKIEDWKDLGDNFEKLFTIYSMDQMLCPVAGQDLSLSGFEGTDSQQFMVFSVEQCTNTSNWTCYSSNQTQNFMTNYFVEKKNDFFRVQFLVVNTIISPHSSTYIRKTIDNQIFLTFGTHTGSRGIVKMSHYDITTDNSIWPVTENTVEKGHYIEDFKIYTIQIFSNHYVKVLIEKSKKIYTVTRGHDKLDNMLSYVGGLFALLFGWLYFFIGSYNEYCYEFAVAESSFAMDETGKKIQEKKFGFFTYLQYCIFDWMKAFHIKMDWRKMEEFDQAREEVCQQMDTKYLIKRIQRFERMIQFLLEQHGLVCSHLMRPPTLDKIKELRKITQYYDKVIKVEFQQSILMNLLNSNKFGDNKVKNQQQMEEDLDSDDEEVEKKIIKLYEKANKSSDKLTKKICSKIPILMKNRLDEKKTQIQQQQKMQIFEIDEIQDGTCEEIKKESLTSNNNSGLMVFNLAGLT